MHTQNPVIHDSRDRQHVKGQPKLFPELDVVSSFTLIVEPIHSVDRLTLVIASEKEKVVWEFNLESKKEADSFD